MTQAAAQPMLADLAHVLDLLRYAASDRVSALVLVTSRALHLAMPGAMGGKPVRVVRQRAAAA